MTPDELLEPKERYDVVEYRSDGVISYGVLSSFETGEASDLAPPPLPIEVDRTSTSWNICGDLCPQGKGSQVEVHLSGEGLIVVDLGGSQALDIDGLSGFVSTAATDGELVLGGGGGCGGPWPAARGETLTIRYGAFDLAGNFSGWTEEDTVTMPKIPATCSCNCSATRARDVAPIASMVVGLLLLGWRRRRRRGAGGDAYSDADAKAASDA